MLKRTGLSQGQKFACSVHLRQNIWNKINKSCKTGQEKKSLLSIFACF